MQSRRSLVGPIPKPETEHKASAMIKLQLSKSFDMLDRFNMAAPTPLLQARLKYPKKVTLPNDRSKQSSACHSHKQSFHKPAVPSLKVGPAHAGLCSGCKSSHRDRCKQLESIPPGCSAQTDRPLADPPRVSSEEKEARQTKPERPDKSFPEEADEISHMHRAQKQPESHKRNSKRTHEYRGC